MTYRRPSLFWPIILIGVGVIFLLNNLDVIRGNPWTILWQFWPVLLIVIGLDILVGRRSAAGSLISALLAVALVGFVIWLLIAAPTINWPGINLGGELKQERVAYDLGDIRSATAEISFSTGQNQLYALSDSGKLIEADIQHYGDLEWTIQPSGDRADIHVGERGSVQIFGFAAPERWNVGLNPRVSYALDVSLGAGEATLDLSRLSLTGGSVDVGVGSAEVRLPDAGRFTLRINGGVGSLRIIASRETALRAEVNTGIGSFNNDSRLRSIGGDVYETEGFSSAQNAITLIIDVGVGSVTIQD